MKISGPISSTITSLPGRNSIVHTDLHVSAGWCSVYIPWLQGICLLFGVCTKDGIASLS